LGLGLNFNPTNQLGTTTDGDKRGPTGETTVDGLRTITYWPFKSV